MLLTCYYTHRAIGCVNVIHSVLAQRLQMWLILVCERFVEDISHVRIT
jgi:hypothetical protein